MGPHGFINLFGLSLEMILLIRSVWHPDDFTNLYYSIRYSATCNAKTSIACNTILWTLYSTMCNAVYRPIGEDGGMVVPLRTGVEKDEGMSVRLRTGIENHDICLWQSAWESRKNGI